MKVGDNGHDISLGDALDFQENYGVEKGIQNQMKDSIKIVHRGKFATICCDWMNTVKGRQYILVLENSYETNYPSSCCCLPPNTCCTGRDNISKVYFDRGVYACKDESACYFCCADGQPSMHEGSIAQTCFCMDCPKSWNNCWSCHCPEYCGEKVSFVPFKTCLFCCPTRACWLHNCFGFCGPKSGEPLLLVPFAYHLLEGEGFKLAKQLDNSRSEWCVRTGKV